MHMRKMNHGTSRDAKAFIAMLRDDPNKREEFFSTTEIQSLEDLLSVARGNGWEFNIADLQIAFAADWTLRYIVAEREQR